FVRYSKVLHGLTTDFVRAVPDDKWEFTPGVGFAPFCKQLRHLVCARGVYNAALASRKVDWARRHEHYAGPLSREALLDALDDQQRRLCETLKSVDVDAPIDWDGTPFTFAIFTWEFVQHEAIHHGQWSLYASLGGFDTPLSWRASWGL
ncbi:MAG TPA: DinB family protein, partial [Vicinamibacterales bacterium]|nr:DinB family protein [Vicinamibacterales bacterium]